MSATSLLPDNRTLLETALEKAISGYLLSIDSPYPDLWSAQDVPLHLLPYLAHAKGVTDWGDESEQHKRKTVAGIWPVQRLAGTKKAVLDAVSGLGINAQYLPWYQHDGSPYSFQLRFIGGLRGAAFERVLTRLEAARSERDRYTLRLQYQAQQNITVKSAVVMKRAWQVRFKSPLETIGKQSVALGNVVHQAVRYRINLPVVNPVIKHSERLVRNVVHIAKHIKIEGQ